MKRRGKLENNDSKLTNGIDKQDSRKNTKPSRRDILIGLGILAGLLLSTGWGG